MVLAGRDLQHAATVVVALTTWVAAGSGIAVVLWPSLAHTQ